MGTEIRRFPDEPMGKGAAMVNRDTVLSIAPALSSGIGVCS